MTKEELEKEAKKWLCNNLHSASEEDFIKAMVDIAEPREKHIAELEKEKCELLGLIQGKDKVIKELKEDNKVMADNYSKMEQKFYFDLAYAKAIIKGLLDNSDEYARQRAIDFLKED